MRRDAEKGRIMGRIAFLAALGLVWAGCGAGGAAAAPRAVLAQQQGAPAAEVSSQARRVRRPPVRITVYPRTSRYPLYPRGPVGYSDGRIDFFPRPYPLEWPGPFATRECTAWLAAEARPSGPVVVPHRRCWWNPG
jgi:hypothetical protein